MKLAQWTTRLVALLAATLLAGCGYNDFQRLDEEVKAGWSEVLNQYQRRSRPDPQHRGHRQGRGQLRAGDADQGDRGARQGHQRSRPRPS
jgi:hypothetical protein